MMEGATVSFGRAQIFSTDTAAVHESVTVVLNILEAVAIAVSEPRLNLQRGPMGKVKQHTKLMPTRREREKRVVADLGTESQTDPALAVGQRRDQLQRKSS
jgi:hypothetical protein